MLRSKTLTILVLVMFALSFGGKLCCVAAGDYCLCCADAGVAEDHPSTCDCEDCVPVDSEHPAQCDCEDCVPVDRAEAGGCCSVNEHPAQCDCEDCVPVDSIEQGASHCDDCVGTDCASPLSPCKAKEQCVVKTLAEPKTEQSGIIPAAAIALVVDVAPVPASNIATAARAANNEHIRPIFNSPIYLTLSTLLI